MGNILSSEPSIYAKFAMQISEQCINSLKELKEQNLGINDMVCNDDIFEASLLYLQNNSTLQQLISIFEDLKVTEAYGMFKYMLGCCYLEMLIISHDTDKRILNFWPCLWCPCITISNPNTEDTIIFETFIKNLDAQ